MKPLEPESYTEHELGELERLGAAHALTGIWLLILQHWSPSKGQTKEQIDGELHEQKKARAAIDLIKDSSDALSEVLQMGLFIRRAQGHHGEAYLRFWGVLNAAYLFVSAIRSLHSLYRPNRYEIISQRLETHPLYEWRMRLGSHVMDYDTPTGKKFHKIIQTDMFRTDGRRSFVSSDGGYQEFNVMDDIRNFEQKCLSILLELTEWKARRVIKRKSDHHTWLNERLEFVRGRINSSSQT